MLGCIICAVLLMASLYIIIKSYKGAKNDEIEDIDKAFEDGGIGIVEENRRWDQLNEADKIKLQQEVVKGNIKGIDAQWNQRKIVFDNAIQDRDLIFIDKTTEHPPHKNVFIKVCDIEHSPFVLYRRWDFDFINRIINLL